MVTGSEVIGELAPRRLTSSPSNHRPLTKMEGPGEGVVRQSMPLSSFTTLETLWWR